MSEILDSLKPLIANTAGALLFSDLRIFRTQNQVSDGRGGFTRGREILNGRGIVTDYEAFMRQIGGIPLDQRRLIIQAEGLSSAPIPEDIVELDLVGWIIIEVSSPPGQPIYECRVRPTQLSLAEGLAPITLNLGVTTEDVAFVGGVLVGNQGGPITAQLSQSADDSTLSSAAVVPITIDSDHWGGDATLSSSVVSPIGVSISATAGDAVLSAVMTHPLGADLSAIADDATLSAQIGGANLVNMTVTADDATLSADADNPTDVSAAVVADDATLSAGVSNPVSVSMAATTDDATLSALLVSPLSVDMAATADDATLAAQVSVPIFADVGATADDATLASSAGNLVGIALTQTADNATLSSSAVVVAAGGNEAETDALIAQMTVAPDSTREGLINDLIAGGKADGWWSKLEYFYSKVAHDSQAATIDWKDPTRVCTYGSGTFTADAGYYCSSAGGDNQILPAFTWGDRTIAGLGDAHIGTFILSCTSGGNEDFAEINPTAGFGRVEPDNEVVSRIFKTGFTAISTATDREDLHVVENNNGTATIYLDGVGGGSKTGADRVFADTDAPRHGQDMTVGAIHFGEALTATDIANIDSRLRTFFTAIGAI